MLPFGAMQGQGTSEPQGRNSTGPPRGQPAAGPRRLVVKLGSSLLARPDGLLDEAFIARMARGVAALCAEGRAVLVVSSGAVAAGRRAALRRQRPLLRRGGGAGRGRPVAAAQRRSRPLRRGPAPRPRGTAHP